MQYVVRHTAVPLEELTLDPSVDAATELLARFDPRLYRIDLGKAPLFRVAIADDRAHNRWLLLLLMHHLILDHTSQKYSWPSCGRSWRIRKQSCRSIAVPEFHCANGERG